MKLRKSALLSVLLTASMAAQAPETVTVKSATVSRKVRLPGELLPFMKVEVRARVAGYVEAVEVDRGSAVKKGQVLVRLSAPELAAQVAEAEARAKAVEAQRAEAEAKSVALLSTYERLKQAAQTPGVIAGNELEVAGKQADASRASVKALETAAAAALASVAPLRQMLSYLTVEAPFDGVVTDRLVHPGALVGPSTAPLLLIEQQGSLRMVVGVPESEAGSLHRGGRVEFHVPAYPGQTFGGTVARIPNSLDARTRTMPVELDVANAKGQLAPGMYAEVDWPAQRSRPSLLVPPGSVVTTTERTFVIRVRAGRAEWVNVNKGLMAGDLLEVLGPLKEGDVILKRASDEVREGTLMR